MTDLNVTVICSAADKPAAQAICTAQGDGPGTFSIPLATVPGITNPALATHWGMSGYVPEAEVAALDVSLQPMVKVFYLSESSFMDQIAACTPPLFRIYEEI